MEGNGPDQSASGGDFGTLLHGLLVSL